MAEEGRPNNLNDESLSATRDAVRVDMKVVGMDQPFFTALAVVLSIVAAVFCFFTEMREERRVYFTQRCEAYIEQAVFNHAAVPYKVCGPREK